VCVCVIACTCLCVCAHVRAYVLVCVCMCSLPLWELQEIQPAGAYACSNISLSTTTCNTQIFSARALSGLCSMASLQTPRRLGTKRHQGNALVLANA
jgi:hypothetical protein